MRMTKSVFLLLFLALAYAVPAVAQERIELYADMNRTECALSESADPPVAIVYVWLTGPIKATGVRFTVPKPACWVGASWAGDAAAPGVSKSGNSQSDWSIAFFAGAGSCIPANMPPVYLGAVYFFVTGQSLPCCEIKPMPVMPWDIYDYTDCQFSEYRLADGGQRVTVNANASCPCQLPVAVEPTTWGRVKSLYR